MQESTPPESPDATNDPQASAPQEPAAAPEVTAEPYEPSADPGRVFESAPGGEPAHPPGNGSMCGLCHAAGLASFVAPIVGTLAPLGVWYFFQRGDARVERHAKEAFNFQVNMLLWGIASGLLVLTCLLAPLGIVLALASAAWNVVLAIVASVKSSQGEDYRYPLIYRFLD